mmetsp:Transcript_18558/g.56049  ORF Transcript_18558/g.56049 Transcript_18558/m.56049 type:complete len:98 (+) Transcript_18558:646-939(+)
MSYRKMNNFQCKDDGEYVTAWRAKSGMLLLLNGAFDMPCNTRGPRVQIVQLQQSLRSQVTTAFTHGQHIASTIWVLHESWFLSQSHAAALSAVVSHV